MVGGLTIDTRARDGGAPITEVEEGSQAAAAGFKAGDLIIAMEGKKVHNGFRYYGIVGTKPRGSQFTFKIKRGEETVELVARNDVPCENNQMTAIPRMADDLPIDRQTGVNFALPWLRCSMGAGLQPSDDPKLSGVQITAMPEEGPCAKAGLAVGDVITSFNGRPVAYRSDITDMLIAIEPGTEVKIKYMREGKEAEATIVTAEPPPAPNAPRQPRRR
jgi:S1-C subfamily serine protease